MQIKAFLSAAVRTGQFKRDYFIIFQRIFMIECFIFELGCSNSEKSVKMRS